MQSTMIDHALYYYAEGISVVPCKPRDKAVALPSWKEYQYRQSTTDEIIRWWTRLPQANIGLVHGVNGYAAIDIDHDSGALAEIQSRFPALAAGRIEQSGSGAGYHVPLFLQEYPDIGWDNSQNRPRGNRTWKTPLGNINIRARFCQTVAPPSVHPCGGVYRHIREGAVARVENLNDLIAWLDALCPRPVETRHAAGLSAKLSDTTALKRYYPDLIAVFRELGIVGDLERVGGEVRILGHGGLVVKDEYWYDFTDEMGGDVIDAFGWVRYGTAWNRHDKRQFAEVAADMRQRVGVGQERRLAHETRKQKPGGGYWR